MKHTVTCTRAARSVGGAHPCGPSRALAGLSDVGSAPGDESERL